MQSVLEQPLSSAYFPYFILFILAYYFILFYSYYAK